VILVVFHTHVALINVSIPYAQKTCSSRVLQRFFANRVTIFTLNICNPAFVLCKILSALNSKYRGHATSDYMFYLFSANNKNLRIDLYISKFKNDKILIYGFDGRFTSHLLFLLYSTVNRCRAYFYSFQIIHS
jgi:hypothetical protein